METLAQFDFTVTYLPGRANLVADALSRRSWLTAVELADSSVEEEGVYRTAIDDGFMSELLAAAEADEWYARHKQDAAAGLRPDFLSEGAWLYRLPTRGHMQLVIPDAAGIKRELLYEAHDAMSAGHMGVDKTYRRILEHFWWPRVYTDVLEYVTSCPECQVSKANNAKQEGLLKPLAIPDQPWESVSLDILSGLPKTSAPHKFDAMAVFVCRLTKMVRLAPMRKATKAPEFAKLFLNTVFRSHGLPKELVSDRDPRFVSRFWKSMFAALGTKLCKSSAYHPQTDGQTERANRTVLQILRTQIAEKQNTWADALPFVEFAYNSSVHAGSKYSPFMLNQGYQPHVPAALIDERRLKSKNPTVQGRLEKMRTVLKEAKGNLEKARVRMEDKANRARRKASYKVGDRALLSTRDLSLATHVSRKLSPLYVGPFRVLQVVVPGRTVRLELPPRLQRLHPVFHVSRLRPWTTSALFPRAAAPQPAALVEEPDGGGAWYEVECLVRHEPPSGRRRKYRYLVKWRGYDDFDSEWELSSEVTPAAIKDYWQSRGEEPPPRCGIDD